MPTVTSLYNYVTSRFERGASPRTDEEAMQYIPQHKHAQTMYALCRKKGESVIDAMEFVLDVELEELQEPT